jgi:hypothetical protein
VAYLAEIFSAADVAMDPSKVESGDMATTALPTDDVVVSEAHRVLPQVHRGVWLGGCPPLTPSNGWMKRMRHSCSSSRP